MREQRLHRVRSLAAGQRGAITYEQLLACGLSASGVDRLVAAGRLLRAFPRVYFVEFPPRPLAREAAALLHLGDAAALSHTSAGFVWGAFPLAPSVVSCTFPGHRGRGNARLTVHSSRLTKAEVTRRERLRITSPERTAIDLMLTLGPRGRRSAVNELIALGHTTPERLLDACTSDPRRGSARLRELPVGPGRVRGQKSRGEILLGRSIASSLVLPEPETNVVLLGKWEIDFYWPEADFYIEVDGGAVHSTPEKFERDRLRDAELQLRGIVGQRVTWRQIRCEAKATLSRIEAGHELARSASAVARSG